MGVFAARWVHSHYPYESARERHRQVLVEEFGAGESFAALIRNGHFLHPMSHTARALPEGHIERIYGSAQGTRFTPKQLRTANCVVASHGIRTSYHRWQSCPFLPICSAR